MDTQLGLTEAALLDALTHDITVAPEDAKTVDELAAKFSLSIPHVRRLLQKLQREGRLQQHRVMRTYIDGRRSPKPAYTISPAP